MIICWGSSVSQTDTAKTDTTIHEQIQIIQSDVDEIKEMCEKQRKLLEKKLKEKKEKAEKDTLNYEDENVMWIGSNGIIFYE